MVCQPNNRRWYRRVEFSEPNGGSRLSSKQAKCWSRSDITELDVNGSVAMQGRLGLVESEVPVDGKWYDILLDLNALQAFEITAQASVKGSHCVLHAIAVSAFESHDQPSSVPVATTVREDLAFLYDGVVIILIISCRFEQRRITEMAQ